MNSLSIQTFSITIFEYSNIFFHTSLDFDILVCYTQTNITFQLSVCFIGLLHYVDPEGLISGF